MKKIIILILLLTVTCCLFLVPTSKVSASEDKVYINNNDSFNTTEFKYFICDINDRIDINFSSSYCSFKAYYHPMEEKIVIDSHTCYFEEVESLPCHNLITSEPTKLIIEFLQIDNYYQVVFMCDNPNAYVSNSLDFENDSNTEFDENEYLNSLYSDLYESFFDVSDDVYSPEYFNNLTLDEKRDALFYAFDKIWELGETYGNDNGYNNGYDVGYDAGYSSGEKNGYLNGYNTAVDEFDYKYNLSVWGPLYNSSIDCSFNDIGGVTNFNSNLDDDIFNGYYLDFSHLVLDTYIDNFSDVDSIPDDFTNSFNVFIDPTVDIMFKDLYFESLGIKSYTLYFDDGSYTFDIKNFGFRNTKEYLSNVYDFDGSKSTLSSYHDKVITGLSFEVFYWKDVNDVSLSFDTANGDTFLDGYYSGYDNGYSSGLNVGYDSAYEKGYSEGYGKGYSDNNFTLTNLFWIIAGLPFESFKGIWSVEFLGVNIAGFVCGLLMFAVCLYIIKKVIK